MAGIVQTDETRARIVPRVFADVPTQAELDALKKSRNGLAIWLVLLVGILIAAIAGLAALYVTGGAAMFQQGTMDAQLTGERSDIISKLAALEAPDGVNIAVPTSATPPGSLDEEVVALVRARDSRITQLTRDVEGRDGTIEQLQTQIRDFSYYSPLQSQRQRAAELKADIAALLADPRWRGARAEIDDDDFAVYERGMATSWREAAEESLTTYVATLQRIYDEVADFEDVPTGPTDPRPSRRGPVPVGDAESGAGATPQ